MFYALYVVLEYCLYLQGCVLNVDLYSQNPKGRIVYLGIDYNVAIWTIGWPQ